MPIYVSDFPIINVTVDVLATIYHEDEPLRMDVVLVQRKSAPFKGKWALPGGFLNPDERLADAASRELSEETGLLVPSKNLEFMGVLDDVGRDPRGRTISHLFAVDIHHLELPNLRAGDDAASVGIFDVRVLDADSIAFDHADIVFALRQKPEFLVSPLD